MYLVKCSSLLGLSFLIVTKIKNHCSIHFSNFFNYQEKNSKNDLPNALTTSNLLPETINSFNDQRKPSSIRNHVNRHKYT